MVSSPKSAAKALKTLDEALMDVYGLPCHPLASSDF
jgi:hypothetical protein